MNRDRVVAFNGLDAGTEQSAWAAMNAAELYSKLSAAMPVHGSRAPIADSGPPFRPIDVGGSGWRGEPPPWIDPLDLRSSGYAVVYAQDILPEVRDALSPLLRLRKQQAGGFFRDYEIGPEADLESWLSALEVGPGAASQHRLPFFVLLVGNPDQIPFSLQFDLGTQRAVGRLWFKTAAEYANYAESVQVAEMGPRIARRAAFFGVANQDDGITHNSRGYLLQPMLERLALLPGWELMASPVEETKKRYLARLLAEASPAFLFASGHGIRPAKSAAEPGVMGSLVCRDWPGPKDWPDPLDRAHYFAAQDVKDEWDLQGLIALQLSCFSLGTPRDNSFVQLSSKEPAQVAKRPMIAALPRKLLGKRKGALAVIGHVDRAFGYSFLWPRASSRPFSQPDAFASVVWKILDGHPVGSALRYLAERYENVAMRLNRELLRAVRGRSHDPNWICELMIAVADARSYALLGDPAARLQLPSLR